MSDDWNNPLDNKKVFECDMKFPNNGRVFELENINAFKQHWNDKEGLLGFQKHLQELLNLD